MTTIPTLPEQEASGDIRGDEPSRAHVRRDHAQPLAPCPFCGGHEVRVVERGDGLFSFGFCGPCGAQGPVEEGKLVERSPADRWNRRLPPEPTAAVVAYVGRYGSRCRDCADEFGICPSSGLPCDPDVADRAIRHVLDAVRYGLTHGYLPITPESPTPSATVATDRKKPAGLPEEPSGSSGPRSDSDATDHTASMERNAG